LWSGIDAAFYTYRDGIGDLSVLGDRRWAGSYGIDADFIPLENTHVAFVETREIKARMKSEESKADWEIDKKGVGRASGYRGYAVTRLGLGQSSCSRWRAQVSRPRCCLSLTRHHDNVTYAVSNWKG
jgi:predicted aminopeptidase